MNSCESTGGSSGANVFYNILNSIQDIPIKFGDDSQSNINESHLETFTKLSADNVSKADNYSLSDVNQSDLHLNIFKSNIPSENNKYMTSVKRRIALKDLISYLETNKRIPLQNLILHKAILKLNSN